MQIHPISVREQDCAREAEHKEQPVDETLHVGELMIEVNCQQDCGSTPF